MKRFSQALAVLLLLAGCSSGTDVPQTTMDDLHGTAWTLVSLVDEEGSLDVPPDTEITLVFGEQGGVTGAAGCNRYFGSVEATDDEHFAIGPLGSTRMACDEDVMAVEDRYLRALEACERATGAPERLDLEALHGHARLTFAPAPGSAPEAS